MPTAPPTPSHAGRRLATIPGTAEYVGVTPKTIERWIRAGRITAYRVGPRLVRIDLNEIDAMIAPVRSAGR